MIWGRNPSSDEEPEGERGVDEEEGDDGDIGAFVGVDHEEVSDLKGGTAIEQRDIYGDVGEIDRQEYDCRDGKDAEKSVECTCSRVVTVYFHEIGNSCHNGYEGCESHRCKNADCIVVFESQKYTRKVRQFDFVGAYYVESPKNPYGRENAYSRGKQSAKRQCAHLDTSEQEYRNEKCVGILCQCACRKQEKHHEDAASLVVATVRRKKDECGKQCGDTQQRSIMKPTCKSRQRGLHDNKHGGIKR